MADKDEDVQETQGEGAAGAPAAHTDTAQESGGAEGAEGGDAGQTQAPRRRRVRKTRVGVVTSDRSQKTVTVSVERTFAHPLYGKRVARTKKYHAHDENDEYQIGDVVRIVETRPLSRTKRWRVVELIERPV